MYDDCQEGGGGQKYPKLADIVHHFSEPRGEGVSEDVRDGRP